MGGLTHRYLLCYGLEKVFLRVPDKGTRWSVLCGRALTTVARHYGKKRTAALYMDGFVPWATVAGGITKADDEARELFDRIDRAYAGDREALAEFDLWAWNATDASYVLVRGRI